MEVSGGDTCRPRHPQGLREGPEVTGGAFEDGEPGEPLRSGRVRPTARFFNEAPRVAVVAAWCGGHGRLRLAGEAPQHVVGPSREWGRRAGGGPRGEG